jgi:hypothetical protein
LEDDGKAPNPIESTNKYPYTDRWKDSLIRYSLELVWSINKLLTDLVCELKDSDEVAYTEAKAHRDPEQSAVIAA